MSSLRQKIVPRGSACELLALCLRRCLHDFVATNVGLAYRSSLLLRCGCSTRFSCRAPWLRYSSTRRLIMVILMDETCSWIETKWRTVILSCKSLWCMLCASYSSWIKWTGVSLRFLPWPSGSIAADLACIEIRWATHIVVDTLLWGSCDRVAIVALGL